MFSKYRIDFVLLFSVLFAVGAGIFVLYTQETNAETSFPSWMKQSIFFGLGLILMFALRKVNYQVIGGIALPLYGVAIFLLLITLIPFIGSEHKGARSWIRFGAVGFQTSEIAKLATIILLAKYLELKERELEHIYSLLIPFGIAVLPMLLIVVQPDFGGAFVIAPILLSMLYMAGADIYHIGSIVIFFAVSIFVPLYIEYHNIMLVDSVLTRIGELGKDSLMPAVRILKSDIWAFLEKAKIPEGVTGSDREYLGNILTNQSLFIDLQDAAESIRIEEGGMLLRILDNDILLLVVALLCTFTALGLFIWRLTQGVSFKSLRKYYIPLGVIGISILSALSIHWTFSFKYHQVVRVTAFINPDRFPRGHAYQIRASKAAIGSGQWVGQGMFDGEMTIGDTPVVPEAHTDFIYTAWAERTGFLGSVFLLLILAAIPLRALQMSYEARDRFGSLLAAGLGFMFFYHIFFNVGIALGLLPVTGLPLSFVSYGGSHLITSLMATGILLSIFRRKYVN
ncbi:MAG: rod shape-determining protein RodA [Leptospiraceae bacterium]|nr:rod shape-determining protein RodA [Leptospiraceae bacterium]